MSRKPNGPFVVAFKGGTVVGVEAQESPSLQLKPSLAWQAGRLQRTVAHSPSSMILLIQLLSTYIFSFLRR